MSLTSKQIDELRAYAKDRKGELAKLITDAADTIEELSAKLHASQMERSSQYYHGGWIPCSERLPMNRDWYLGIFREPDTGWINPIPYVCDYVSAITSATTYEGWILHHCTDQDIPCEYYKELQCVAWMPLPEPYREDGEADD